MKKFKTFLVFALGIIATAVFGACSCTKESTITVTSIKLSTDVESSKYESERLVVDVIVGDEFNITYDISPKASTNTKTYINIMTLNGDRYLTPESYSFDNAVTKTVKFTATAIEQDRDVTPIEVRFTTESANHTATAIVNIHDLPEQLTTPQNLKYDNSRLEWDAVENADGYYVYIGVEGQTATPYYTNATNFDPANYMIGDKLNEIYVVATSSNVVEFTNSTESTSIKVCPLQTPEITGINNGIVAWKQNDMASNYSLIINTDTNINLNNTITSYDLTQHGLDQYKFKIKAYYTYGATTDNTYIDEDGILCYVLESGYSELRTINHLGAPNNLKITNNSITSSGLLSWTGVSNVTGYTIKINDIDGTLNDGDGYSFTTRETYVNLASSIPQLKFDTAEFGSPKKYRVTVSANGDPTKTVVDEESVSGEFDFVQLSYLSGTIVTSQNKLTIDTSKLLSLGLNNDTINNLYFQLTFVKNVDSATRQKAVVVNGTEVDLTSENIDAGEYSKVLIRPYLPTSSSYTNISNAGVINVVDEISTLASGFTKLPSLTISKISKDSKLTLNIDAENVETFEVYLDDLDKVEINKDADCITIGEDNVVIDLTKLSLGFGTTSLAVGTHKLKVYPIATNYIDATKSFCGEFGFEKLNKVSSVSVQNNSLNWGDVEKSYGYDLTFNNRTNNLSTNSYTPILSSVVSTNSVTIIALGNDQNVINSDAFDGTVLRASKVETFKLNDGVLEWDDVEGSTYNVTTTSSLGINQTSTVISTNKISSFNISTKTSTFVNVVRKVEGQFDSQTSDTITIQQRDTISDIKPLENSEEFELYFETETPTDILFCVTDTKGGVHYERYSVDHLDSLGGSKYGFKLSETSQYLEVGTNKISAIKLGNSCDSLESGTTYYVNGVESRKFDIEVYPSPTITIVNGQLKVELVGANNPPATISITVSGDNLSQSYVQTKNVYTTSTTFDLDTIPSGEYSVVASVSASKSLMVIGSDSTQKAIEKIDGTNIKVVDGELTFDNINGAQSYEVSIFDLSDKLLFNTTTSLSSNSDSVNLASITNSLQENTNYKLKIRVLGGNAMINSSLSEELQVMRLPRVGGISKSGNNITWDKINNCARYKVTGVGSFNYSDIVDQIVEEEDIVWMSVDNDDFTTAGKYQFSFVALGNTTDQDNTIGYLNSTATTYSVYKLNAPKNITLNNGVLSWSAYTKVGETDAPTDTIVRVVINGADKTYNCGTSTSLNLDQLSELKDNGFKIYIQYKGDNNQCLDSDEVAYSDDGGEGGEIVVSRLNTSNVYVVDGELRFDKVTNAGGYDLYLKSGDNYTLVAKNSYTLTDNDTYSVVKFKTDAIVYGQEYSVCVKTLASDYSAQLDSEYSSCCKIAKLNLPKTALSIGEHDGVSGVLVWENISNATNYTIYVVGANSTSVDVDIVGESTQYYNLNALNLGVGSYSITLRANGSATTNDSVNYLNSDVTNSVSVSFKDDAINVAVNNDILKWASVEGVNSYMLTISHGSQKQTRIIQESGDNSYNLKTDSFVNESGGTYTLSVVPFTLQQSYYLVDQSNPVTLEVLKNKNVSDLKVFTGYVSWSVDFTGEDSTLIEEAFNKYANNTFTDADKQTYEKYFSYCNFELVVNGVSNYIVPDSINIFEDTKTIQYTYEITDVVTENTKYVVNVRSRGNNTITNQDGSANTSIKTTISSNLLSTNLEAYKTPAPSGITTKDGKISFNLITTGDESNPYIKKYYIYGVPKDTQGALIHTTIEVSQLDSVTPSIYTYDVGEWTSGLDDFKLNSEYVYYICSTGTSDSSLSSGTYYLRSNYYESVTLTFLSDIALSYTNTYTSSEEDMGAVIYWNSQNISEDVSHVLYIMENSIAYSLGNSWWKNEVGLETVTLPDNIDSSVLKIEKGTNIIKITLASSVGYFDFSSQIAKLAGIQSNTLYRVVGKYSGDERTFVVNKANPSSYVAVKTLSALNTVYLEDGVFAWNAVTYASKYKVELYRQTSSSTTRTVHYTQNSYFAIVDYSNNTSFAVVVTPLGQYLESQTTNFVNGYANTDLTYYSQVATVIGITVVEKTEDGSNILQWESVEGASGYMVEIDGNETKVTSNQYTLNISNTGDHNIRVKALADPHHLNGFYSNAVTVTKLYSPQPHTNNGIVVWDRGDNSDTILQSTNTQVVVQSANEDGETNNNVLKTVTFTNGEMNIELDDEYDAGWYVVSIKYVATNRNETGNKFQLSSDRSQILVKKLDAVSVFEDGKYYDPTTDEEKECSFDNFIKWKMPENAQGFEVSLYDGDGNIIDSKTKSVRFENNVLVGNTDYFAKSTKDNTYMCFNLAQLNNISEAYVRVVVLGNSTTYGGSTTGYLNSKSAEHKVEIPIGAPEITSAVNGVVRWSGAYKFADGNKVATYQTGAVASSVEIEVTSINTYKYDLAKNARGDGQQIDIYQDVWQYSEDAEQVYYIPYASASNMFVRVRYFNSNYVTEWSPKVLVTDNNLFVAGTGTDTDPYIIAKLTGDTQETYQTQVLNMQYRPNSHFYILNDVDLNGKTWTKIANFGGQIDGKKVEDDEYVDDVRTISNLTISSSMFGNMTAGSGLMNINLLNVKFSSTSQNNTAIVCDINSGTIINVSITGSMQVVSTKSDDTLDIGVIAVTNNGTISNCEVNLQGENENGTYGIYVVANTDIEVGGVVVNNYGTILYITQNSIITTAINDINHEPSGQVAGIVYRNQGDTASVENCTVLSTAKLTASRIGGIAYENSNNATITHCAMLGECCLKGYSGITENRKQDVNTYFGGLVAINKGYIRESYISLNSLTLDGLNTNSKTHYIGLLVGLSKTKEQSTQTGGVQNCYVKTSGISLPTKSTRTYTGYVAGYIENSSEVFDQIYVDDTSKNLSGSSSITVTQMTLDVWKSENDFE